MNRIEAKFKELRRLKKKAFVAYITAGDPSLAMTERIVLALERSGVDIIEVGIPFSDPLADGPTIQAASERALKKGVNLKKVFRMTASLRKKTGIPVAFMTYYNPVLKYGLKNFASACAASGVDGVIIPDLPGEEASSLMETCRAMKVATIFLAAPTSTPERVKRIAHDSTGFIYYVSLTGVTGTRKKLPFGVISHVKFIKSVTSKPVCVGFGVSTPAQAHGLARIADGVIVGSAIVKIIGGRRDILKRVSNFARGLARAIHGS